MTCDLVRNPVDIDLPALRERYALERDVRVREDGEAQYVEVAENFADYYETDPWSPPIERAPIREDIDVAVLGGGFAGAWFTLGTVGRFDEGMTGGRGFIGLAAAILARSFRSTRLASVLAGASTSATLTARDAANNTRTANFTLTVAQLITLENWRQTHFGSPANTGNVNIAVTRVTARNE